MSRRTPRARRVILTLVSLLVILLTIALSQDSWQPQTAQPQQSPSAMVQKPTGLAAELLATVPIKGRAPKTDYARTQFGNGWALVDGCSTREIILHRDMPGATVGDGCKVLAGTLQDPYTGKTIAFQRGAETSAAVQIDHVVALSNAWQTGAQLLTKEKRAALANDPLELLAVDGPANQAKGDGDAATWLPPSKLFRCQYIARQIAVKAKYSLWVTQAEHDAMSQVLASCPGQPLPQASR